MKKIYDPIFTERKWYNFWEENNYFVTELPLDGCVKNDSNFCIMLPPPNVTGSLHMGHAFQHTLMDLLIRFNRMQHKTTLWQSGIDHAGISTQMVVERQLAAQNIKRTDLSREEFVAKVWEWKEQSGGTIQQQMKRLGTAIDWDRSKFTLDPKFSDAVKKVFIELYDQDLIYRGKKLVNWDPTLQTAVSDLEVITEEIQGKLWHIKYPLAKGNEFLTIATTRPETLLGDVAVCVNPLDERYQHLIGEYVILPIVNKKIPIISDDYVDPSFGTGCLKITPGHDFNDYAIGIKHNLPLVNIFTNTITLNENTPQAYQGLDQAAARKKILEDLEAQNLLAKTEDHLLKIPKSSNTNTVIEPLLTNQWFVKMKTLAIPAIEAVRSGQIKFVPTDWDNTYYEWLNNIQDWCISRQLWWGHQIPAWYDQSGNIYVAENEEQVRAKYNLSKNIILTQETDVLDTWFSAALWPFVTLGWPEETIDYKTFFPTSVLVTGFDIIFFWVARMIMFSLKFTKQVPFHTVYVHGLIQDQDGQKMSKSKGNVLDPIDLVDGITLPELISKRTTGLMQPHLKNIIEQKTKQQFPNGINSFGVDALRFTFCALATHNRHIKFELLRLEGYRNFSNKIWNAARFVLLHIENEQQLDLTKLNINELEVIEKWILSIWQSTKQSIIDNLNNYRFDLAAKDIYEFVWNEYCDWYLEFSKPKLMGDSNTLKQQVKEVLTLILAEILMTLHPIMPYITEEIWQSLKLKIKLPVNTLNNNQEEYDCLINCTYPSCQANYINSNAEQEIIWLKKFIMAIRNIRSSMNIAPGKIFPQVFVGNGSDDLSAMEHQFLLKNQDIIKIVAKIKIITINDQPKKTNAITALVNQTEVWVLPDDLIDHIDYQQEINKLNKEIIKLEQQLAITKNKLDNQQYLKNAPQDIVLKEQKKYSELQASINKLRLTISRLVPL